MNMKERAQKLTDFSRELSNELGNKYLLSDFRVDWGQMVFDSDIELGGAICIDPAEMVGVSDEDLKKKIKSRLRDSLTLTHNNLERALDKLEEQLGG